MKALEAGIEVEYVQELVRKCNLVPEVPPLALDNWPWTIRIATLGEFRLEKDGQPLRFSGKVQQRPLAMLKALVAFGGQGVTEEQLTDALWPEADGDVGHQSFATTLHRLRQLVGHEKAILLQGGQVNLDARYCWVDTWAFEQLLEQADQAERRGRIDQAGELSEKALTLYKGPFLNSDAKASWALLPRERLRNKFLRSTSKLGQRWEQAGEWRRAIECYEKGLDVDGLAEEFYQRQMVYYQRLGRRAEALVVYQRCRRILAAVLGVSPSPETEALYRSLRSE
jgi:DNA-binding SARP family transcriptional activator